MFLPEMILDPETQMPLAPSLVGWWWRAGGFGSCSRGGLGAQLGGVVRRCPGRGRCSGRGRVSFLCALGRRLGRRLRRRVAGGMDGGLVVAAGCGMRLRGAQG